MRPLSIPNRPTDLETNRNINKLWFLIPLVLVLVSASATIACGTGNDSASEIGITSIIGDESSSAGYKAPNFSFSLFQGEDVVGGQELDLHSLIGSKPIVLNFWAGLCPPCRAEMPDLQEFNQEYKDQALLLGIDLGQFFGLGNLEDAKNLLKELEVTYPAGSTADSDLVKNYKVLAMPTTIFINTDGTIVNKWTGALNSSVLSDETTKMLER